MSRSQLDSLIHMANQIAANNAHYGDATVERVHNHLKKFWARSMKRQIVEYLQQDGSQLSPLAREAVALLAQDQAEARPASA
ncbi:MAG: formate dehydrogenase subunit delta [Halomonas sp.]|jgi:formate dehydrogenase subunit delta|uniref:Formate dehydrogenase n=1 Tax=Billgrantia tianxiuensis TaxID=2497861 RepID=A0A6I6SM43_9GAMM|nr:MULTISPECIES: formate dehydrogenase subunit delta [Halomonas]MCE8035339.1 formate dehydrogenase subunit delta [Halomonas sp. MCCC 1A11057]MDX5432364.1 formate dehydrogenase subunit delta [Halomonas sp.]QHC51858.1 formate dehydrogenase [Halomonas tianxiuensis]